MIPPGESKVLTETSRITVLINNHDLCHWLIRNCKRSTKVQILQSMSIEAELFCLGEKISLILTLIYFLKCSLILIKLYINKCHLTKRDKSFSQCLLAEGQTNAGKFSYQAYFKGKKKNALIYIC